MWRRWEHVPWGMGSRMRSATVPLDRAALSSVTTPLSLTAWPQFAMQILTEGSTPKYPFPEGYRGPCLIQCYLAPYECPCQMAPHSFNGFSKVHKCDRRPTNGQTDRHTDRPRYGNICRNRRNRFKRWRLLIHAVTEWCSEAYGLWGKAVTARTLHAFVTAWWLTVVAININNACSKRHY